ncbi:ATP-binding protein [Streptomyces sp. CJ_13]|uniref:ATP-binding protein n=1 Tax=Streptomyces sp. CJ_13 TaxID=2724943 RepID=UPI001BDBB329|nr:ATP-binding protein [Streptomyces sp. CJ_13]MBT1184752.1 ATP-binding protein [Streptomyces sp. CJ_13]
MLRSRAVPAVLISLLAVMAVLVQPLTSAWAEGPDVGHCNSWVCSGVKVPGKPPTDGGGGGGGNGGGSGEGGGSGKPEMDGKTCATGATRSGQWPCKLDGVGDFDDGTRCYVRLTDPQPPKSDPIWAGHTDGAIYTFACMAMTNTPATSHMEWRGSNPVNTGPTAAELAQQAFARMRLDGAKIGSAPPAGAKGLIGMPVWLWTEQTPQTWGPQSTTAAAGGLSVTVTAKVASIAWSMGDGTTITCTKPGTPYREGLGKADSPDCGHRYSKIGIFTITATSTWTVEWVANTGQTGTIPDTIRTSTTTARIGELQVVN